MTETSTTPSSRTTFVQFMQSEANDVEICYIRDALGDAGMYFPEGADNLIGLLGSEEDNDLISAVDELAIQMEGAGQAFLEMIKRFEELKESEEAMFGGQLAANV
jgi:hypothetical protein